MNALFIQRMSDYQHSELALQSAQVIVTTKINRSNILLKHFSQTIYQTKATPDSLKTLLLHEARAARRYWHYWPQLLPRWTQFTTRTPHAPDITNRLLDIGYHHLAHKVSDVLTINQATTALGLLHRAQTSDAQPLVYDLMELFRADVVDMTVLTWLRQKKRPIARLSQKQIAHFIHENNERLQKKYYLADFKQCHSYQYYLNLQIVKFIKAVNHGTIFEPIILPTRHDTRCTCQLPKPML